MRLGRGGFAVSCVKPIAFCTPICYNPVMPRPKPKKMEINTTALSFRVPPEVKSALEIRASHFDLTLSEYLRQHVSALARNDAEISIDLDVRLGPSSETFSISLAEILKQSVRGLQKTTYLAGFQDALSMRRKNLAKPTDTETDTET